MDLITSMLIIFIILIAYYMAVELYTILFRMTGLNKPISRFQVMSMIVGVGFTTAESELIVEDSRRRKIAIGAIITGALLNTVIIGLLINFMNTLLTSHDSQTYIWLVVIVASFFVIMIFMQLPFVKRFSEKSVNLIATNLFKMNTNENVITLLDKFGDDVIAEVLVNDIPDMLKDKTVFESGLKTKYSINILMIKRNKGVISVKAETMVIKKDTMIVFGKRSVIEEIFKYKVKEESIVVVNKNKLRLLDNYGKDAMVHVELESVPKALDGIPLEAAGLRSNYDLSVLNIIRDDKAIRPKRDTMFFAGDELVVYGPLKSIETLFEID